MAAVCSGTFQGRASGRLPGSPPPRGEDTGCSGLPWNPARAIPWKSPASSLIPRGGSAPGRQPGTNTPACAPRSLLKAGQRGRCSEAGPRKGPCDPWPLGVTCHRVPSRLHMASLLRPPCTRGHVTGRPLDLHTRLTVVFNPRNSGTRQAQPHILKDHARPPLSRSKRRYLFIRVTHTSVQITGRATKPAHRWRTAFLVALPPPAAKPAAPPGEAEERSIY